MAINSPLGENSVFDPSFEWMGDSKDDKSKSLKIEFESVEQTKELSLPGFGYVSLVFKITSQNLNKTNAKFKLTKYNFFGIMPEKPLISDANILPNGEKKIKINIQKLVSERSDIQFDAEIICDGISSSTGKFKIGDNLVSNSSKECFCLGQELIENDCKGIGMSTSDLMYTQLANELDIEKELLFAIAKKESKLDPFVRNNPKHATILLERHYVYRLISKKFGKVRADKLEQDYPSLCNKTKTPKGQFGTYLGQIDRLNKVKEWDTTIAIQSCSWGKFQIMGEYLTDCNLYKDAEDFEKAMNQCEIQQFQYFKFFLVSIKGKNLINALRKKDWENISYWYNGKYWKDTNPTYPRDLKKIYDEIKK